MKANGFLCESLAPSSQRANPESKFWAKATIELAGAPHRRRLLAFLREERCAASRPGMAKPSS